MIGIGDVVLYWTQPSGLQQLVPHPAIVLARDEDGRRLWLHVFWVTGHGGRDSLWATLAPLSEQGDQIPTDGHWTSRERV